MEKFIENLQEIIIKNCFLEDNDYLTYKNPRVLVLTFGLLILTDCALKYSNQKTFIEYFSETGFSDIELVDNIQDISDDTIYINKIFDLEKLEKFDKKILDFIRFIPKYRYESFFPDNVSFKNKSRFEILSTIIETNDEFYEYILKKYPKNELRNSEKLQKQLNDNVPAAFFKEEDLADFLSEYLNSLNDVFIQFIESFNFTLIHIDTLKSNFVLSDLIKDLTNIEVPKENFSNPRKFLEFITAFTNKCLTGYMDINWMPPFEYDLNEVLVDLLFTDINLDEYSEINIYDPFYFSKETLEKSKKYVNSKNKNCIVNLYKKINLDDSIKQDRWTAFNTTLESLLDENNHVSFSKEISGIPFSDLNISGFDFVISDYRAKDISKDPGFIHTFQEKLDKKTKLVVMIRNSQFYNKSINWMIKNDNLEAILVFDDCHILIANSNKNIERKDKFILIDYNILVDTYGDEKEYFEYNDFVYSSNNYSKDLVSKMLNVYRDFEDSEFSKVINNKDVVENFVYDELDKYWGDYYKNSLERLLQRYQKGVEYSLRVRYQSLENIPSEVLKSSKEYFNENCPITPKEIRNELNLTKKKPVKKFNKKAKTFSEIRRVRDINIYLKDFNYNHLMYDKKRKPYTITKQKKIGGNKSKIVEEIIKLVPLYKLITFDPLEFDGEEIGERKVELFNEIFYLKSDKFLRKFIVFYLLSGKGMEEYDFFKCENLCSSKKDFIYIRIPDIPLETQEKIIQTYELNEDHYNLVKQSRDNFRKNILDYEKLERDMENFNDMEIDVKTGQIKTMSTTKRHLLDGLLWPLSISYLNAVHGTHVDNPNEKLDFYLKLFEFLAAFIDIVLVSAMPKEEYEKQKKELWDGVFFNVFKDKQNNAKSFKHNYRYKGDFGTWTTLYAKLLKCYREQKITPTFSNDLIESFLDDEIYEIIDMAREIRNKHPGHGPGVSQSLAKKLIEDLKEKIDFIYEIFGYLNGFKLFYCEDDRCKIIDNNNFKYSVVSLNGPCDQPIYGEITFNKTLKEDTLYLSNSLNGDLLELNPNLIIFDEAIDMYEEYDKNGEKHIKTRPSGRYYLYVFNGFNKRKKKYKVNYKCHQIYTTEKLKEFSFDEWEELLPTK